MAPPEMSDVAFHTLHITRRRPTIMQSTKQSRGGNTGSMYGLWALLGALSLSHVSIYDQRHEILWKAGRWLNWTESFTQCRSSAASSSRLSPSSSSAAAWRRPGRQRQLSCGPSLRQLGRRSFSDPAWLFRRVIWHNVGTWRDNRALRLVPSPQRRWQRLLAEQALAPHPLIMRGEIIGFFGGSDGRIRLDGSGIVRAARASYDTRPPPHYAAITITQL